MSENKIDNIKNPSPLMRPAPFWSWNDKLDEAELRRQIREMAQKGWGSYFMHSRVGLVTKYLSDEWMDLINACADEAEKTGTYAWLYDEDKWPSGYAGGEVPESSKDYRSRAIVLLNKGKETKDDEILLSYSYGGVDYSICKRISPLNNVWFNGTSYVDLMSPDAVRKFIECTHERYKKACGKYFGKSIPGIFTDEPCYIFNGGYGLPVVPWSEFLPDFFKKMKGYNISDKLPQLFFDVDDYRKVRFDFYDAASALFKQSFTKQYYDWCEANNLKMTGHFMSEDSLCYQTQWSGDVMAHYEFMHWPGIDKLSRHIQQVVTCKQLSSAVDQLGKERSFCEVYGCVGGQVSFFHRKWIGDWQAALGISFVNHHLSLYSMRGERKRDYPANLFYQQPWWNDEREFADYQGRLCTVVSEGERLVDILLFQPLTSVWSEYSPLHADSGFAQENTFDKPFENLSKALMAEKLDHHYGNETLMAKHACVENGKMKVGRHSYSCVIVPPCSNLKSSTVDLFTKYCKAGGKLIFVGSQPTLVDGIETKINIPGAQTVASIGDAVAWADKLLADRVRVTDKLTDANAIGVYVHARKVGSSKRYLFVNTNEKKEVKTTIHIPGSGDVVGVFDLFSGNFYKLNTENESFDATFAPAGSLVVICGSEVSEAVSGMPEIFGSGVSFASFDKINPLAVSREFECRPLEDNVFLLNDYVLEMDGKTVYEGPICGAWHKYFYSAKEGTPFKATYKFNSECAVSGCFAAIEMAENLDCITFNGKKAFAAKAAGEAGAFDPSKSWKDINFTKVPLSDIVPGENVLIIEGKKVNNITGPGFHCRVANWKEHNATEAEEAYILGNFTVKAISDGIYTVAAPSNPEGKCIEMEGYPFYCGKMEMKASFDLADVPEGKVFIRLNSVEASCIHVKLNGQDLGTLRWMPFVIEASKALKKGKNELELVLVTNLVNAFGPNRRATIKEEDGIGPGSFIDMNGFTSQYQLFRFGVLGAAVFQLK